MLSKKPKWCPGCGNYSILTQVKKTLLKIGIKKENTVFVSGVGCSSRFPYYINTFGLHGTHGRATSIATGIKIANPKLNIWVITGDGDGLSIGTNHLIHLLRRNLNINILLFNNEIYGLTKGQISPTSNIKNKIIWRQINPISIALGAQGTFIARSIDINYDHLSKMIIESYNHKGTSLLEIYQNCNIFNDGAFDSFKNEKKHKNTIYLKQGEPIIFGKNKSKGIIINKKFKPEIVKIKNVNIKKLWIHDEKNNIKAFGLADFIYKKKFPRPFGIIYKKNHKENKINNNNKNISLKKILSGIE